VISRYLVPSPGSMISCPPFFWAVYLSSPRIGLSSRVVDVIDFPLSTCFPSRVVSPFSFVSFANDFFFLPFLPVPLSHLFAIYSSPLSLLCRRVVGDTLLFPVALGVCHWTISLFLPEGIPSFSLPLSVVPKAVGKLVINPLHPIPLFI